jgi:hypothetical protein
VAAQQKGPAVGYHSITVKGVNRYFWQDFKAKAKARGITLSHAFNCLISGSGLPALEENNGSKRSKGGVR